MEQQHLKLLVLVLLASVIYYTFEESLNRLAFDTEDIFADHEVGLTKVLEEEYDDEIDKVLGGNKDNIGSNTDYQYLSYQEAKSRKDVSIKS